MSKGTFPALPYLSESELETFEGWLRYQAIDLSMLSEEEAAEVREVFEHSVMRRATATKVGRMKLRKGPDEAVYAIALRDQSDLWLALWIRRSSKAEVFLFHPTTDGNWNPHTSLHRDGRFHLKSHNQPMLHRQKQPPASLRGTEHLGAYGGFSPKAIGAVCDPSDFTEVFEVSAGVLGPRNGVVTVDLFEPGSTAQPFEHPAEEVARHLFTHTAPHVMVRVFRS